MRSVCKLLITAVSRSVTISVNNKRFSAVHHPRRKAQGRSFVMVFSLVKIKRNLKKYKSFFSVNFPKWVFLCRVVHCAVPSHNVLIITPWDWWGKITDGYMKVDENCICTVCVCVCVFSLRATRYNNYNKHLQTFFLHFRRRENIANID